MSAPWEMLKECPFCGGQPEIGHVNEDEWGAALDEIRCVSCQVGGLRAGWQKRAPLRPEIREALELAVDSLDADAAQHDTARNYPRHRLLSGEARNAAATLRTFLAVSQEGQK